MNLGKLAILFLIFALICSVNAAKGTLSDATDECATAKEICDYAWEMQSEYEKMPKKTKDEKTQRKAFGEALTASVMQCERAKKECAESVK
jgi:hypothetical protein